MGRRLYLAIVLFCSIFYLQSCINIKSEYPPIEYYQLPEYPSILSKDMKLPASLQIRDCSSAEGIDSDHLFAIWDNGGIKRYFYHRWISDAPTLVNDFFKRRYSELNVFTNGIVNSSSLANPDYVLELRLLQMDCHSSNKHEEDSSFVEVSMSATLSEISASASEKQIVLSQNFKTKVKRPDSEVKSIAPAFGKAFSELSDMVFAEFYTIVSNSKNIK
jgi:ABC-type uncharacterized transport system auxiliary subunit